MTTKKIIVGYDGSAGARAAAGWALDEAARTGAEIEFLHCAEWPDHGPAMAAMAAVPVWPDGEIDRRLHGMMREAVATARDSHPAVRTDYRVLRAPAATTLRDLSRTVAAIVLGSRGHHAGPGVLGSVGVAVSAHAHCPVVVVRGTPRPDGPVVAGVDGSACSLRALRYAAGQARSRGAKLVVVAAAATGEPDFGMDEPALAVSTVVTPVHPARALTEASADAQLVVVGSRGRGAFRGMLLGSVGQHLLRTAECPVAVIRESD